MITVNVFWNAVIYRCIYNLVILLQYLEGPNEDGSFASLVDDGKVYISALFLASGVKYFEHRYDVRNRCHTVRYELYYYKNKFIYFKIVGVAIICF